MRTAIRRTAIGCAVVAVALLVILAVDLWLLGTSMAELGGMSGSTSISVDATLTADQPVAVRIVTATAVAGPLPLIDARVGIYPRPAAGVWFSAYDLETGTTPGDILPCGAQACTRRYALVSRWLEPVPGPGIPVSFAVTLQGSTGTTATLRPDQLRLAEDAAERFAGDPPARSAQASGTVRLTGSQPETVRRLFLTVPAADLVGPLAFPLVGRTRVTLSDLTKSSDVVTLNAFLAAAHPLSFNFIDGDWLSACAPARDCLVPIDVSLILGRQRGATAPSDWAAAKWTLDARLELLASGGEPLPGSISLSASTSTR